MDPIISLAILIGGLVLIGLLINRKLSDLADKQKPSDELLEVIKMLQAGSKEDRKVLRLWKDAGYMEGGASGLSITKEFWNFMCEILWIGYVDYVE